LVVISGKIPVFETAQPVRESVFVKEGSRFVSIEIEAPGIICLTDSFPLCNEIIFCF